MNPKYMVKSTIEAAQAGLEVNASIQDQPNLKLGFLNLGLPFWIEFGPVGF